MGPVHWDDVEAPDGWQDLALAAGARALTCERGRVAPGAAWRGGAEFALALADGALTVHARELGPGDHLLFGTTTAPRGEEHRLALDAIAAERTRRGRTDVVLRDVGRAGPATVDGLQHCVVAPGAESYPPHCHSAEEELFVVLAGSGALRLGEEEHPVRPGHVVARPAGPGVAHSWRAGDDGLTFLAHGQRDTRDVCWYPRSRKLSIRGVGIRFRVEPLDYWDGEE